MSPDFFCVESAVPRLFVGEIPDGSEGVFVILTGRPAEIGIEFPGPEFRGRQAQTYIFLAGGFASADPAGTDLIPASSAPGNDFLLHRIWDISVLTMMTFSAVLDLQLACVTRGWLATALSSCRQCPSPALG